jgi:hypothetical protein
VTSFDATDVDFPSCEAPNGTKLFPELAMRCFELERELKPGRCSSTIAAPLAEPHTLEGDKTWFEKPSCMIQKVVLIVLILSILGLKNSLMGFWFVFFFLYSLVYWNS